MIELYFPGKPIAKKRPRFARKGKFVITYSDQETEEGRFLWELKNQLSSGWVPLKCPIKITSIFYMKRPKNHYKTGKYSGTLKEMSPILHITKPDIDNLQKMVYDCFNQVVWVDDSLICEVIARKEYSENPRTEITITEVGGDGKRT